MILFNAWYYSFSPQLSASMRTHPRERAILRGGMYPLVAVLYTSYYIYALVSPLGIEEATVMCGIVAASLLGLIYLAPIAFVVKRLLRRHAKSWTPHLGDAFLWVGGSILALGAAYSFGSASLGIAAANLVLSMLTLAALVGSAMLTSTAKIIAHKTSTWRLILGDSDHRLTFGLTPPCLESKH